MHGSRDFYHYLTLHRKISLSKVWVLSISGYRNIIENPGWIGSFIIILLSRACQDHCNVFFLWREKTPFLLFPIYSQALSIAYDTKTIFIKRYKAIKCTWFHYYFIDEMPMAFYELSFHHFIDVQYSSSLPSLNGAGSLKMPVWCSR